MGMFEINHSLVDLIAGSNLDASLDKADHVLILEERQRQRGIT